MPSTGPSRVATLSRAATGGSRTASGLAHLLELQAVQSAGDALVAVSLAGTPFFGVPVDEARGVSKAYAVSRGAVIPRVLPGGIGLVRANARLTLAGLLTATVAAGGGRRRLCAAGTGLDAATRRRGTCGSLGQAVT